MLELLEEGSLNHEWLNSDEESSSELESETGFRGSDNDSMDPLDTEQHGFEMFTSGMSFQSCKIDTFLTGHDSPRPATAEVYSPRNTSISTAEERRSLQRSPLRS